MALHSSGHTWNQFLHHISTAKNLLSAFCRKHNLWAMWEYIWSKWMLGCAADLWSLVALLKLTWFHLGAQTPTWTDSKTCTLYPHFKSCWGPSALKPEQDFLGAGGGMSWIPNLITHLLKWCPAAAQTAQAPNAQKLRSLLEHFYAKDKPTVPTLWSARTSRKSDFAGCSNSLTINYNREGTRYNLW